MEASYDRIVWKKVDNSDYHAEAPDEFPEFYEGFVYDKGDIRRIAEQMVKRLEEPR
ncbi:hypothetical protein SAMN05421835_10268 [Amycolatopsis sacchari]|uniref:Uncharacterized protein n=1 Tax=Amycolatopsis sacchari TaxID=115433 RepID=A0A1I3LVY2_9PSEU|nr:hypothetical protein SAMN05421835_10268 [Amycolatopsis sacchari]